MSSLKQTSLTSFFAAVKPSPPCQSLPKEIVSDDEDDTPSPQQPRYRQSTSTKKRAHETAAEYIQHIDPKASAVRPAQRLGSKSYASGSRSSVVEHARRFDSKESAASRHVQKDSVATKTFTKVAIKPLNEYRPGVRRNAQSVTIKPQQYQQPDTKLDVLVDKVVFNDIPLYTKNPQRIHKAVAHRDYAALQQLVAEGADLNAQDGFGRTAIHIAIILYDSVSTRILHNAKAKLNIKDTFGMNADKLAGFMLDNKVSIGLKIKAYKRKCQAPSLSDLKTRDRRVMTNEEDEEQEDQDDEDGDIMDLDRQDQDQFDEVEEEEDEQDIVDWDRLDEEEERPRKKSRFIDDEADEDE